MTRAVAAAPAEKDDDLARFASRQRALGGDDALVAAKQSLADGLELLGEVLGSPAVLAEIGEVDRSNLAKYLMIVKLRLENAITVVRSGRALEH